MLVALSDYAADSQVVGQPCYGVHDNKTLIGQECVGTFLKRFLDNLTASELAHVLKEVLQKSADRLVTDKSLGVISHHSRVGQRARYGYGKAKGPMYSSRRNCVVSTIFQQTFVSS